MPCEMQLRRKEYISQSKITDRLTSDRQKASKLVQPTAYLPTYSGRMKIADQYMQHLLQGSQVTGYRSCLSLHPTSHADLPCRPANLSEYKGEEFLGGSVTRDGIYRSSESCLSCPLFVRTVGGRLSLTIHQVGKLVLHRHR